MIKIFSKTRINTTLFVVSSLIIFTMFAGLYVFIMNINQNISSPAPLTSDRYYLNYNYKAGDPLITKQPNLRDILLGPIISTKDPSFGDKNAPITVVVFSDYECTFCNKQAQELKKVISQNSEQVRLVWKDYPDISSKVSKSYQASIAARCAGEQDKFWEYHDLLFKNNQNLYDTTYLRLAKKLDLNINDFKKCQKSDKVKKLINDNILEANALDIKGVPFVYINDQEVLGQSTAKELIYLINVEMKQLSRRL